MNWRPILIIVVCGWLTCACSSRIKETDLQGTWTTVNSSYITTTYGYPLKFLVFSFDDDTNCSIGEAPIGSDTPLSTWQFHYRLEKKVLVLSGVHPSSYAMPHSFSLKRVAADEIILSGDNTYLSDLDLKKIP